MTNLTETQGQPATEVQLGRRSLLMWSAATLALAGCGKVAYEAPVASVGARFDGDAPPRNTANRLWWTSFRDPALDQLIAAGNARNLSVLQAIETVNQAQASAQEVGAAALPQVSANATGERGIVSGATQQGTYTSAGAQVSWMLDLFGKTANARAAAGAQLDAAYLSVDIARLTMESSIAAAYIDLRFYQESIALTNRSLESRRHSLDLTKTQFDLGSASRLDVLQADQLVAEGEATLPPYEVGFDQALAKLATLTNQRISDLRPRLRASRPQPTPGFRPGVGVPADVVRDRPDVRAAERSYAAAVYNIGVAKAAFYPSVSLSGSITPTNIRNAGNITYWAIGPSINLPIFTGGANTANLSIAESKAVQSKLAWEAAVLGAIQEIEMDLAAYNRDGRNIAAQQRLVNTSKETTDLSRSSYEIGQGTFINVLDAERAYLTAQQSLASAVRQQAANYVALSVAAAGGTAH